MCRLPVIKSYIRHEKRKLYTFEELSEDAQQLAHEQFIYNDKWKESVIKNIESNNNYKFIEFVEHTDIFKFIKFFEI